MSNLPENLLRNKDAVWTNVNESPFSLYGVSYSKERGFLRMPYETAQGISDGVCMLCSNTAGGRVKFRTDSEFVAVSVSQKNNILLPHMPLTSHSGLDLYKNGVYLGTFSPKMNVKNGFAAVLQTGGGMAEYTVNMPLYDNVTEMFIGVSQNAVVLKADDYKIKKPFVFYGSSITEGASASRPGNCYTALVSRFFDADHINLGFAANCFGEPDMAEYIASLDMSLFVMALDHNCKSADELNKCHFPFYETVRRKNKTVPIIFVSSPNACFDKEGFALRRAVITNTYNAAKKSGDNNVYFLDGQTLYEGENADGCTVDGTHPNDLGFYRISKKLECFIKENVKNVF